MFSWFYLFLLNTLALNQAVQAPRIVLGLRCLFDDVSLYAAQKLFHSFIFIAVSFYAITKSLKTHLSIQQRQKMNFYARGFLFSQIFTFSVD